MADVRHIEVRQDDLWDLLDAYEEWLHHEYFELDIKPTVKQCALIKRINFLSGRGGDLSQTWWHKAGYDIEREVKDGTM